MIQVIYHLYILDIVCICGVKTDDKRNSILENKSKYNTFLNNCLFCLKDKKDLEKYTTLKLKEKDGVGNKCFNLPTFIHIICKRCIDLYITEYIYYILNYRISKKKCSICNVVHMINKNK